MAIPIGKRPKKRPKKNEHSAAFIARQQTGGILSHVRRTLVWGLKITKKIHRNRAGPTASASEVCGTKREALGILLGLSVGLLVPPLSVGLPI